VSPDRETRRKQQAAWYALNREAIRTAKAEWYLQERARRLCYEARRRAKRKGIAFSLTAAEIADLQLRINAGVCEVTGVRLDLTRGRKWNAPSIDREDSSAGYTHDNLRIVCHALNAAMGDWGEGPVWEMLQTWLRKRRNS